MQQVHKIICKECNSIFKGFGEGEPLEEQALEAGFRKVERKWLCDYCGLSIAEQKGEVQDVKEEDTI